MNYKINQKYLIDYVNNSESTAEYIINIFNCIKAIFILLEVTEFAINEELYNKIPDKDKDYFTLVDY